MIIINDPYRDRFIKKIAIKVSVTFKNISLDIILLILWTHYAHALLKLKIQTISFYAAKTTENTDHFFLRCQNNLSAHTSLMNELNNISNAINSLNSIDFVRVIFYEEKNFDNVTNSKIITATIKLIKTTKRFEEALF